MPSRVVGREAEALAIEYLLTSASAEPAALILEGEPGIGKTTVWHDALTRAAALGFTVLTAQASQAESVMAYTSLADLLNDIDATVLGALPAPQSAAIDRVLLRATESARPTDAQAVAAGFLSAIERAAQSAPVLIAIDDLQWLDVSSLHAVGFAARRFRGRVAILATVRVDNNTTGAVWFQLRNPDGLNRVRMQPLDAKTLNSVITDRLSVTLSRPSLYRIHGISGGNPLYAMELVRAMGPSLAAGVVALPASLAELVESRITGLEAKTRYVLLAAACAAKPTVELISQATDSDVASVIRLLEVPEDRGIVQLRGNTVHFTHPLLAHGVYAHAGAASRRAIHRRLSEIVTELELRARHLALAATTADPKTVQVLDAAALASSSRGAPAAAAELLELAIGLGGDTEERWIRAAGFHAGAGDLVRARTILEGCVGRLSPGELRAQALVLLASVRHFNDDIFTAAELLDQAHREAADNLLLRASASVAAVFALYNTADVVRALACAEQAVEDAVELGNPVVLGQALGMRVLMRFSCGHGVDDDDLKRALELESDSPDIPIPARPSMHHAQLLSWTGHFDEAVEAFDAIYQACVDRGHESDLLLVSLQKFVAEFWRGNLGAAALLADDAADRAQMLGGEVPRCVALMMRCATAGIAGRVDEARAIGADVIAACIRCGMEGLVSGPMAILGMVENATQNYQAALDVVAPALFDDVGLPSGTEFMTSMHVPEGIEALIHLGRYDEAEPFISSLERNGARVDRPWTLAMGARYRSMLHAARGDLELAVISAQTAMEQHDRFSMPFERARTQLLVSSLQRRQRQRGRAAQTLGEALATFERVGAVVWVEHARRQARGAPTAQPATELLWPAELRVAELAGKGLTNRDVAAALFISPKTVEANLSRIYRKLGIRSRAELGRHMGGVVPPGT